MNLFLNEELEENTANTAANYSISGGLTILTAELDATNSSLVHLTLNNNLNSGENYFYSDAVASGDRPAGYVDVSSSSSFSDNSNTEWFTLLNPDIIVVNELGVRDNDDDNNPDIPFSSTL